MLHASELHCVGGKMAEYLAGWQRARAELINFRQQTLKEQEWRDKQTRRRLVEDLMPLADNFQAMVRHIPIELKENQWVQGVAQVAKQLEDILSRYNVRVIRTEGETFDPELHEAVETVRNDKIATGMIIELVRTGYIMDSEVIRPARVKVAK